MDVKKNGKRKAGFFANIGELVKAEFLLRKNNRWALLTDVVALLVAFIFARRHIAFGSYPLHIAFLAVLPRGVFTAMVGGIVGSLSLGKTGISGALAVIVTVFLRAVLSSMHANKDEPFMFREPLLLRICSAIIGAFVGGMYVIVDTGIDFLSVACLLSYILLSSALSFVLFGVFDYEGDIYAALSGEGNLSNRLRGEGRYSFISFAISFFVYVFFISMSLGEYDIFGISPAYIFASALTLFFAKRFGKLPAMAVGFVSSFVLSPLYAVGFSLMGLVAGLLFCVGVGYGIFFGGCAIFLWSLYTGGAMGLLSVMPEYSSTALIITPMLKKIKIERIEKNEEKEPDGSSREMVNTTVMAYISKRRDDATRVAAAIASMGDAIRNYREGMAAPHEIVRAEAIEEISSFCRGCRYISECKKNHPTPCMENLDKLLSMVYISSPNADEVTANIPSYCKERAALTNRLLTVGRGIFMSGEPWQEYEIMSTLLKESDAVGQLRCSIDENGSERLSEILRDYSIYAAYASVLGDRRTHLVFAGEDKDGSLITSSELHKRIESGLGIRLGAPEYYRRGSIALCEVATEPLYTVESASVGERGGREEISGDSIASFTHDGYAYTLISDGMGSGEVAVKTSRFVCDFLESAMTLGAKKSTLLHALNKYVRECADECSASVDLFEFDTLRGEGCFYKCGAADSFIKRGESIFRIRSETAPIGLMRSIDAEKIRVQIKDGDHIIMISDGINQPSTDAAWLLEGLHRTPSDSLTEYAEGILAAARENNAVRDDMTVSVVRICARG